MKIGIKRLNFGVLEVPESERCSLAHQIQVSQCNPGTAPQRKAAARVLR